MSKRDTAPHTLLTTRLVCERYGIVDRTVDRWVEAGILPRPMYIQGRRYFSLAAIAELEIKHADNQPRRREAVS